MMGGIAFERYRAFLELQPIPNNGALICGAAGSFVHQSTNRVLAAEISYMAGGIGRC